MIELTDTSPAQGLLPLETDGLRVTEHWPLPLTSLAPLKGGTSALSAALAELGLALPPTGGSVEAGARAVIWTGREQYMLVGAQIPDLPAAQTDQSDAWCVVDISGRDQLAVLARLCPLDLERAVPGSVALTVLGHLNAVLWRRENSFRVMVFRAFAHCLIRELREVAEMVEARHRI